VDGSIQSTVLYQPFFLFLGFHHRFLSPSLARGGDRKGKPVVDGNQRRILDPVFGRIVSHSNASVVCIVEEFPNGHSVDTGHGNFESFGHDQPLGASFVHGKHILFPRFCHLGLHHRELEFCPKTLFNVLLSLENVGVIINGRVRRSFVKG
jgi:hypothetical protein